MSSARGALSVARRYHDGWTSKHYTQATDLLAPTLVVEVPINDYPTAGSFAEALCNFGELVTGVELLAEMTSGDEAMLLYDMQVQELGPMRVVEHFTVAGGKITRLRQIHDTAAIRAATAARDAPDFAREIVHVAPTERIFDALTTLDGLAGWWTPIVSGSPTTGGEIELGFSGLDEKIVMRVDETAGPSSVIWTCLTHSGHPEWEGTTIVFKLTEGEKESGVLKFRHVGLSPTLSCYEVCEAGWDHFLTSLLNYAEHGEGRPF